VAVVFGAVLLIDGGYHGTGDPLSLFGSVFAIFGLGLYLLSVGRRVEAAPETLQKTQGSVLYLRAFGDENRPFVTGPNSVLGAYSDQLRSKVDTWNQGSHTDATIKLTLEEFLGKEISARIGPFVGLGNPTDRLPPPGATREYAADELWRERFADLSGSASCIILSVGQSDNLQWELAQIRQAGINRKLCLFTSPRSFEKNLTKLLDLEAKGSDRKALVSDWKSTTATLRRAGFECEQECPGFGVAVTFDDTGKSVLLTTEAAIPRDYVAPVADWITTGTRTGKCIPAACASCASTTYRSPNGPRDSLPVLCFTCAIKARLSGMSKFERASDRHPWLGVMFVLLFIVAASVIVLIVDREILHIDPKSWMGKLLFLPIFVLVLMIPWGVYAGFRRVKRAWSRSVPSTVIPPAQISSGPVSSGAALDSHEPSIRSTPDNLG